MQEENPSASAASTNALVDRPGVSERAEAAGAPNPAPENSDLAAVSGEYEYFFENAMDLCCVANTQGYFLKVNNAFRVVLGYSEAQLLTVPFLDMVHPEDLAATVAELEKLGEGGRSLAFANRYRTADDNIVWLEWNCRPAPGGNLVAVARDITERKRMESLISSTNSLLHRQATELAEARDRAETSARTKSQFLANMSHEVRTPMNGIIGMADFLLETQLSAEQQEAVRIMRNSAHALLSVLNDVLDFSKIEAGKIELNERAVDLRKLGHELKELLRFSFTQKEIRFSCKIAETVPHSVWIDPDRLRQVLMNLLINSFKFTDSGGAVELRIAIDRPPRMRPRLQFTVIDSGWGIDQGLLQTIFDPFVQGDAEPGNRTSSKRPSGAGLGLAISRQLVERMEGTIVARSVVGQGSEFEFNLPLRQVPVGAEWSTPAAAGAEHSKIGKSNQSRHTGDPVSASRPAAAAGQVSLPTYVKPRVLVAEDNSVNQLVASKLLAQCGCEVSLVSSGEGAVAAALTDDFDVIFMDLEMPGKDGYTATREILQEKPGQLIVALTAHALPSVRSDCLATGMRAFVVKPVRLGELRQVLETLGVNTEAL